MTKYSLVGKYQNCKFWFINFVKQNKVKFIILAFVLVIGLFTGLLTAIKYNNNGILTKDYLIFDFVEGSLHDGEAFWKRFLTSELILFVITLFSLTIYLVPIGYFIIGYRTYLLGFNCTLLVLIYGISGVLTSILIILPFQLISTIVLGIYFNMMVHYMKPKNRYSFMCCGKKTNYITLFLLFFILMFLIVLIETLLFWIFRSEIILCI